MFELLRNAPAQQWEIIMRGKRLHKFVIYVNNPGRFWTGLGALCLDIGSQLRLESAECSPPATPGKCWRGSAGRTNQMRATALGAYLWWDDIQIFFSSISQIFLSLEKCCKQKWFSCLDYFYCGHRMMNGWGLPIPGHEYLTFYQMMLRISTGWSQPWLYWSVWQAMLLIREHLWCYLTDNCISSRAPPCSMRCHHRPRRSQRLEFSINNDRRSSQSAQQPRSTGFLRIILKYFETI